MVNALGNKFKLIVLVYYIKIIFCKKGFLYDYRNLQSVCMQTCSKERSLAFYFFLHSLDSRLHLVLQVPVAGNSEQWVKLLTPAPGGQK